MAETPSGKKKPYVPSEKERQVLEKALRRAKPRTAPRLKAATDSLFIEIDHPDQMVGRRLLMEALGTADPDFFDGLLSQLASIAGDGSDTESELNFLISVIKDIHPRDQLEAMLAAQIASAHRAAMEYTRRLLHIQFEGELEVVERTAIKLYRTFALLLEALNSYRTLQERATRSPMNEDRKPSLNNDDRKPIPNDATQKMSENEPEHAPESLSASPASGRDPSNAKH